MRHVRRPLRWLRGLQWTTRQRVAAVGVYVALLTALWAIWPTVDAWGRSFVLFGDVIVTLPVRPLTWFTSDPSTEAVTWGDAGGRGLLTFPGGDEPVPALVLVLGVDPAPPDDPRVERFVDALARLGFAVLFPLSDELEAKRLTPVDVERLVGGFQLLEQRDRVRSDRIAFIGLSAGGSLTITAAADARIAERVWFVYAIGPYYDAASLVASALAGAYRAADGEHEWRPARVTRETLEATLLSRLPQADREGLENQTLEETEARLAELGPQFRASLEGVSPRFVIDGLRAPLYLLHDRNDEFVPWPESERLAAAYTPAVYHRIDLFEHVEPQPGNLPVLLRDGWRMVRLFQRIFDEAR